MSIERGRRRVRSPALLSLLFAISFVATSAFISDPSLGVINVPPQFSSLLLGSREGYHFLEVTVSDYDSWHDILRVDVVVADDYGHPLAHIRFRQYQQLNATTFIPSTGFEELVGGLLLREVSYYSASDLNDTYVQRTELILTFAFQPVRGSSLGLEAVDLGGAVARVRVDYTLAAIGSLGLDPLLPPPFSSIYRSTGVALGVAALITVLLLTKRYGGLARLVNRVPWRRP